MPTTKKGKKIVRSLVKTYGNAWKNVFYGGVTKGKFKGVLPSKEEKKFRNRYGKGKTKKKGLHKLKSVIQKFRKRRI